MNRPGLYILPSVEPGLDSYEPWQVACKPAKSIQVQQRYLTWIDKVNQFSKIINFLLNEKEIGLYIHLKFDEKSKQNQIQILQISSSDYDYLIDVSELRSDIPLLSPVFLDPSIVKIVHGSFKVLEPLQKEFQFFFSTCFDTELASILLLYPNTSINHLVKYFCDVKIPSYPDEIKISSKQLPEVELSNMAAKSKWLLPVYDYLKSELWKQHGRESVIAVFNSARKFGNFTTNPTGSCQSSPNAISHTQRPFIFQPAITPMTSQPARVPSLIQQAYVKSPVMHYDELCKLAGWNTPNGVSSQDFVSIDQETESSSSPLKSEVQGDGLAEENLNSLSAIPSSLQEIYELSSKNRRRGKGRATAEGDDDDTPLDDEDTRDTGSQLYPSTPTRSSTASLPAMSRGTKVRVWDFKDEEFTEDLYFNVTSDLTCGTDDVLELIRALGWPIPPELPRYEHSLPNSPSHVNRPSVPNSPSHVNRPSVPSSPSHIAPRVFFDQNYIQNNRGFARDHGITDVSPSSTSHYGRQVRPNSSGHSDTRFFHS